MKLTPLNKAIHQEKGLIDILNREEEPVLCVNKNSGNKKKMSFRALYDNNREFWKNPTSSWTYYLPQSRVMELIARVRESERDPARPDYVQGDGSPGQENALQAYAPGRDNFGDRYDEICDMSEEQRLDLIREHNGELNELLNSGSTDVQKHTEALAHSTTDVSLVNKSLIEEALKLGDAEAKEFSKELVNRTRDLIRSSTSLIDASVFKDELLDSLVNKSNGTVVQHMTRTYIRTVSFLLYYNKQMLNSSLPNRIRIDFKKKYKPFYWRLLSHFHSEDVVLERVFYSGLQAVSSQQIHTFATGFLLHDIGKATDIDYHEGTAAYDREKVVDHVRQGYLAIMNKTVYPAEVPLITGYHHEYYGHESGYGFYRAQLMRHLKQHPKHRYGYLIGYQLKPVLTFQTFSFFPAKILEIIDVFDALTDPNRKYRKPLDIEEALELMKSQFIEEQTKIDPILFDIFGDYQLNHKTRE